MSTEKLRDADKTREPLISILVPSYNHARYVIECLESVKSLRYERLELILSDDCSSDNTFALADQWVQRNGARFERSLVVRQPANLGIVKHLQFLFDAAQGDYLAYLASDDAFVDSALEKRVNILREHPEIDAVFGNAQLISESGSLLREEFIPKRFSRELSSSRLLIPSLILNWCVPGPVMMLRRTAVLEGGSLGILPQDLGTEDWYIYFRMAIQGKLRYVNEVVSKYRVVSSSMSQSTSQLKFRIACLLAIDGVNRSLLTGFNRFLIDTRIARLRLELVRGNLVSKRIKKTFWTQVIWLEKLLLQILSILF